VNCGSLERWLDEGMPGSGAAAARAHASGCPLCGPRLREAERLEALLSMPAAAAPEGFADRVLARIAREREPRVAPAAVLPEPRRLPWWSWVGADLALPITIAAASMFVGLMQAAFVLAARPIPFPNFAIAPGVIRAAMDGSPFRAAAVTLAALPPVLLLSYALYRSIQGFVRISPVRR